MKGEEKLLDNNRLTGVLTDLLKNEFNVSNKIRILDRTLNEYSSTFPTEIVTCVLSSGLEQKIFCKYIIKKGRSGYGHRGGQDYELMIYQKVLSSLNINSPKYYGAYFDPISSQNILFLEYLENAVRYSKVPSSIIEATTWIATFHKKSQEKLNQRGFNFLKKYDLNYYLEWADRTLKFETDPFKKKYPWLPQLCDYYKLNVHCLLTDRLSIIHGEYYPGNVLYYKEKIVPVDWETAAVGCGVIDLASLIEGWDKDSVEGCINEYSRIMNGKLEVNQFMEQFRLAQIYWIFRWFSYKNNWTNCEKSLLFFDKLIEIVEELQLINDKE